jgi:lipopolysaccharide transport system ATP-binding protein
MSDPIISVENLSKRYLVGHQSAPRERSLRSVIGREVANFARKAVDMAGGRQIVQGDCVEQFWALKSVNFEIKQGEVVGIIGRNGAGKSTLLKILSRITDPSEGRIRLRGRVASLLEVGTGFHPELTGRENIFLNGAILGMHRSDIERKFDEIVAFAGTERFLDLPIKNYSSGMYVRLAFALAAHIEPDILIVDEVLAVGDHEFQQKCLGKMGDVASKEGRTVILVSHNLAAVGEMADRAILLDSGRVVIDGSVSQAINAYLAKGSAAPTYASPITERSPHVKRVEVLTSDAKGVHQYGKSLDVKFWIQHDEAMGKACFSFHIINQNQQAVVFAWALYPDFSFGDKKGECVLTCHFPSLRLNVGRFFLRTHLTEPPGGQAYETLHGICSFEVVRTDKTIVWGWQPDDCTYHEEWSWKVDSRS